MDSPETHLGLSPEEMIAVFNRMYLDVWGKTRKKIDWSQKNAQKLFLQILEVAVTAMRDGAMLALYENNERIHQELTESGVLPKRKRTSSKEG